jgi:quercetin dioxygenase-like cupin family protein
MGAPQPKPSGAERDTFFPTLAGAAAGHQPVPWRTHPTRVEEAAEHGALLGHFNIDRIPPPALRVAAAKGLEGVYLKWLLDENVGTVHHRLLFIEYQPGVSIGLHDHAFEEAYFILSGEVQATLDGQVYRAKAGDVLWTGVGCVHSFANLGTEPVRWLETFAPQPPKENVFRFVAEWDARARELEGPQ